MKKAKISNIVSMKFLISNTLAKGTQGEEVHGEQGIIEPGYTGGKRGVEYASNI